MKPIYVTLEFTPNPNTLKYTVNTHLVDRPLSFRSQEEAAAGSPLAAKLLEVEGIESVLFGKDFVTITKTNDGDWDLVHREASKMIESHLSESLPVLNGDVSTGAAQGALDAVSAQIVEILDREIRPAVAQDGGDITFDRFEEGTVYVYLQGACSGCPSATQTLKLGIENRLKQLFPEVREVRPV